MSSLPAELTLTRCGACGHASLPGDGPCPRCGSTDLRPFFVAPKGNVIASTELMSVAKGWTSPHRLALVEVPEGVRLLAIVDGELPLTGSQVSITLKNGLYHVTANGAPPAEANPGRGSSILP